MKKIIKETIELISLLLIVWWLVYVWAKVVKHEEMCQERHTQYMKKLDKIDYIYTSLQEFDKKCLEY